MFAFVLSRLLQALPVMLVVALISFAMFAYVGDPVAIMLGQDFTEAQRDALVRDLAGRPIGDEVSADLTEPLTDETAFQNTQDTLVLKPDSDFFKYFNSEK